MIDRGKLGALAQVRGMPAPPLREERIPYPRADQVLYAGPNPDGSRKACGNCWKFVTNGACCEVLGEIEPTQVCSLHVFGKAQVMLPIGVPTRLSAAEAGLIDTPAGEGTCCALCRFYEADINGSEVGMCRALGAIDGLPPIVVEPLGCCARWEENPVVAPEPVLVEVPRADLRISVARQRSGGGVHPKGGKFTEDDHPRDAGGMFSDSNGSPIEKLSSLPRDKRGEVQTSNLGMKLDTALATEAYTERLKHSDADIASFEEIPLTNLKASQGSVNPDRVKRFIDKPDLAGNKVPEVIEYKGQRIIEEGHHRIAAAMLRGDKTLRVLVRKVPK